MVSVLFLILLSFLFYVLYLIYTVGTNRNSKDGDLVLFYGNQHKNNKVDCNTTFVYSSSDEQCRVLCSGDSLFTSHNGVCVHNILLNDAHVNNNCDPKKGVLAYLTGDTSLGTTGLLCLSIDPGIAPDNPDENNIICGNGTHPDINYLLNFPEIDSCNCGSDLVPIIIPATENIRKRVICVDKRIEKIL